MSKSEIIKQEQVELERSVEYFLTYEEEFKEMVERLLGKTFDDKTGKLKNLNPQKQKKDNNI